MAASDTMILANIHLRKAQKSALQARAKAHGTNLAEEIRCAVDAYLEGITPADLSLLDVATRQAESTLKEMSALLTASNAKADRVFKELAKIRTGSGSNR